MKKPPTPLMLHEYAIQRAPDLYRVVLFKGRGYFMRAEVSRFEMAVAFAKEFYASQRGLNLRPVAIYAVQGRNQSHVVNIEPTKRELKMTYLLTWKGAHENMKIERYIDMATAKDALNGIADPNVGGVEVDSELELDYPNTTLVVMFNKLAGPDDPQVQGRFSTKADGQRRLFARIEELAKTMPVLGVAVSQPNEEAAVATKTKKTRAPKAAKAPKVAKVKTNGTSHRIDKTMVITKLADGNPLREGSAAYERYKHFRDGDTVEKAVAKGVWMADVRWCVAKKFIKLSAA